MLPAAVDLHRFTADDMKSHVVDHATSIVGLWGYLEGLLNLRQLLIELTLEFACDYQIKSKNESMIHKTYYFNRVLLCI